MRLPTGADCNRVDTERTETAGAAGSSARSYRFGSRIREDLGNCFVAETPGTRINRTNCELLFGEPRAGDKLAVRVNSIKEKEDVGRWQHPLNSCAQISLIRGFRCFRYRAVCLTCPDGITVNRLSHVVTSSCSHTSPNLQARPHRILLAPHSQVCRLSRARGGRAWRSLHRRDRGFSVRRVR